MKKVFFIVGPSQLYPTVPAHIKTALRDYIPSISHRGGQFVDIYRQATDNLRSVMGVPEEFHIFFLGSATEAMERIIQNVVKTHSFHFVNGAFSKKFYTIAEQLGKKAEKAEASSGKGFDVRAITIPKDTECICITQNETNTGAIFPVEDVGYLKKNNPKMLVALDVVSSAPFVRVDFGKVDLTFFSVQKGFGLPAGLGILIVSPAAFEKCKSLFESGLSIGSYHNFLVMEEYARKYQAHETPNVLDIYLLGKVCGDFLQEGLNTIRNETEEKAQLFYEYFDEHKKYKPFVVDKRIRSRTTIVIDTKGETEKILPYFEKKGFVISSGYGAFRETHIRIANFPSLSIKQVKELLKSFREF